MKKDNSKFTEYRKRIDRIDSDIVSALSERFKITNEIGKIKAEAGLPARDLAREEEIIKSLRELSEKVSLDSDFVEDIFKKIMSEARKKHKEIARKD